MAEYIANFELNRNTLEFQGELSQNQLHADLVVDYRPSKTSQLINDSGYITITDVPTKLSELVNDTGFITASALIPLENDIIEIESDILGLQNNKVDKVTGKGLSTNDFTNALKTKLEGIEAGAEVNTVTSVNGQVGDVILDIPTVGNGTITINQGGVLKGSFTTNQSGNATINLDAGGSGGGAVESVNGQTGAVVLDAKDVGALPDSTVIPTKTSDLTNDNEFITNTVNNLTNYYLKSETYTRLEINQLIADIPKFQVQIVQALPQTGEAMVLYLVPKTGTAPDVYDEYIWIEASSSFELIGTTAVDLTGYAKEQWVLDKGYITGINSTDVTNALGYTPYNSSNPSNYTSVYESTVSGWGFTKNTGTVTSVNNVQPVNGNVTLPSAEYTAGTGLQLSDQNEFNILQKDERDVAINVIGNVTNNNGVYSGFSNSNYLTIPMDLPISSTDSWEIQAKFNQYAQASFNRYVYYFSSNYDIFNIYCYRSTIGINSPNRYSARISDYSPTTDVWVKVKRTVNSNNYVTHTEISTNGIDWTTYEEVTKSGAPSSVTFTSLTIGCQPNTTSSYYFNGSIDLNHCYIKVNDVTIWDGSGIISKPVAKATDSLYGLVKPDNTSITVNNGVISAVSSGGTYTAGTGLDLTNNEFSIIQTNKSIANFTIVGNPTINDGVASNFSDNNYLSVANQLSSSLSSFEIVTAISVAQYGDNSGIIDAEDYSIGHSIRLSVTSSGNARFRISTDGSETYPVNITSTNSIALNTKTFIKITYNISNGYVLYLSSNGSIWTQEATSSVVTRPFYSSSSIWRIGDNSAIGYALNGLLYLYDTYVKVDDALVWTPYTLSGVAMATDNLYGLVKPDGTSITVNDGVISANIANSVNSSSTNNQAVGAKLFYDTVGNIETILASI